MTERALEGQTGRVGNPSYARWALLCLLALLPTPVAAEMFGPVEVRRGPEPRGTHMHGYTEYRLFVKNKDSNAHVVTLSLPAEESGGGGRRRGEFLRRVSRTVEVGPGALVAVPLFVPDRPRLDGQGMSVRVDGVLHENAFPLTIAPSGREYTRHYYGRGRYIGGVSPAYSGPGMVGQPLVLFSQSLGEKFEPPAGIRQVEVDPGGEAGGGAPNPRIGPGPPPGFPEKGEPGFRKEPGEFGPGERFHIVQANLTRADVGVKGWSDNWLAYTRFDGVILTAGDVRQLQKGSNTQSIWQALLQWTEAGGVLLVVGPGPVTLPASWEALPPSDGWREYRAAFGVCHVSPDRNQLAWPGTRWIALGSAWRESGSPWQRDDWLGNVNNEFPVLQDSGVPIRGLFVLLLLFGVLIGPVNLIVLTRRRKRIWLLGTVPALSITACLLVFGYMIVAEGWSGRARIAVLTVLDQHEMRATTLGRTAFYSPLTPSDGLRFPLDAEVSSMGSMEGGSGNACVVEWGNTQHLARGWVSARVPAHFAVRRSTSKARQRLQFERSSGELTAINQLGVDVVSVHYADEKGRIYQAGPIAAGDRATLEETDKKAEPGQSLRSRFFSHANWVSSVDMIRNNPAPLLTPNRYLAVVEQSPFLEPALRNAHLQKVPSLVLGLCEAPGDAR